MTTVMSPPPLLNKYVAMTSSIFFLHAITSVQFGRVSPLFFSSPLSFFSEFFVQFLGSNEKEMEARAYIRWETPCRPWGETCPPPSTHTPGRDLFANSKKITLRSCRPLLGRQDPYRPWGGRPGAIFEIFQNGHIFLIFLSIKKKKTQ